MACTMNSIFFRPVPFATNTNTKKLNTPENYLYFAEL